jgi:hypothetical protein
MSLEAVRMHSSLFDRTRNLMDARSVDTCSSFLHRCLVNI